MFCSFRFSIKFVLKSIRLQERSQLNMMQLLFVHFFSVKNIVFYVILVESVLSKYIIFVYAGYALANELGSVEAEKFLLGCSPGLLQPNVHY